MSLPAQAAKNSIQKFPSPFNFIKETWKTLDVNSLYFVSNRVSCIKKIPTNLGFQQEPIACRRPIKTVRLSFSFNPKKTVECSIIGIFSETQTLLWGLISVGSTVVQPQIAKSTRSRYHRRNAFHLQRSTAKLRRITFIPLTLLVGQAS